MTTENADYAASFSRWFSQRLDDRRITQAEAARLCGLTPQHVSRLLGPARRRDAGIIPNPETVRQIAAGLQWPVDEALHAAGYANENHAEPEIPEEIRAIGIAYNQLSPKELKLARPLILALKRGMEEIREERENEDE